MIQLAMSLALFSILSALAFWKESAVPFMVAGGVGLATAFYWFDLYTNTFGLAISLMLLALSFYYFYVAFRAIFTKGTPTDDEE